MIRELYILVNQDIVFFSCIIILDKVTKSIILANNRFKLSKTWFYQTEIIRISINKPEISFQVRIIKKGKTNKFYPLLFFVNNTIETKVIEVREDKETRGIKVEVPVP
jgi:hypothetical protein